jgi:hypothetical protein
MPEVHVFMAAGKTDEQKKHMMTGITTPWWRTWTARRIPSRSRSSEAGRGNRAAHLTPVSVVRCTRPSAADVQ